MIDKIKNLLLGNVSNKKYEDNYIDITNYNNKISIIFSIFAFSLISIMLLLSAFKQEFNSSQIVYFVGVAGSICIFILAIMGKKELKYTWISVYIAENFFLLYGLAIGLFTRTDTQTTTFMVMMVLLPIIFVDRPIITGGLLTIYITIFTIGAYYLKAESVRFVDMVDALIFGLLAIVSGATVNIMKIREFVLESKLKVMSETDQLTGLKNRNSFEWKLQSYENNFREKICCIYVDINGLHQLNNTMGHKVGDEMLQYIAKEMQHIFGTQYTYRIGGDEYVSFIFDTDVNYLDDMLDRLNYKISEKNYHLAIGTAIQTVDEYNILQLIKTAEIKMYDEKSKYYKQTKNDRRTTKFYGSN